MLILKKTLSVVAFYDGFVRLGLFAIPATHMLTANDIVYRNQRASVKAIICANDEYITTQITKAMADSPTVEVRHCCQFFGTKRP